MPDAELPGFWAEIGVLSTDQEAELATLSATDQAEVRRLTALQRETALELHALTTEALECVSASVSSLEQKLLSPVGVDEALSDTMLTAAMAVESLRVIHEGVANGEIWSVQRIVGDRTN